MVLVTSILLAAQLPRFFVQDVNWSPDGKVITFTAAVNSNFDIYSVRVDGTGMRQLTSDPKMDIYTSWRADGKRILFSSTREGNRELYTMRPDGSDVQRLTRNPASDAYGMYSPDGNEIVYMSTRGKYTHLFKMRADGSHITQLTKGEWNDYNPYWSADGKKIIYESDRWDLDHKSGDELLISDRDGKNERRLTENGWGDVFPRWSANGWIIWSGQAKDGTRALMKMRPDGSGETLVVPNAIFGQLSPDGSRLAVVYFEEGPTRSRNDRVWKLGIADPDGKNLKEIPFRVTS